MGKPNHRGPLATFLNAYITKHTLMTICLDQAEVHMAIGHVWLNASLLKKQTSTCKHLKYTMRRL